MVLVPKSNISLEQQMLNVTLCTMLLFASFNIKFIYNKISSFLKPQNIFCVKFSLKKDNNNWKNFLLILCYLS